MASKKIIKSILALRIFTLLALAASIVIMALNSYKFSDGSKISFTQIHAYWYVVAAGGVGFLNTLIQIPFAIYEAYTEKRLIRNGCMPYFDLYGDTVISLVLASGVGVGFGVTLELKRYSNPFFDVLLLLGGANVDEVRSKSLKVLNKGLISSGILLGGFALMTLTSILTSLNRSSITSSSPSNPVKRFFYR